MFHFLQLCLEMSKGCVCQVNDKLTYCFVQVEQVIPLPTHQEVTTHEALPSVAHPSDHIALVCDLLWNPGKLS